MNQTSRYPIPHSLYAEESVLGAAFLSSNALDEAIQVGLQPEHFFSPGFREVYRVLVRLRLLGRRIDPIIVTDELQQTGILDFAGGVGELVRLQNSGPCVSLIADHARIIRKTAAHRDEIRIAAELTEAAYRQDSEGVERVRRRVLTRPSIGYCPPNVARAWQRLLDKASPIPMPTILSRTDGHALVHDGCAVILIGPAGAGKSWLACFAAFSGLMRGRRVAWVDLDNMGQDQLLRRLATMGLDQSSINDETLQYFDGGHFDSLSGLLTSIENVDPDMVVVDCLIGLLSMDGLDENSNGEVRSVLQRLRDALSRRRTRTILVIDHIGHEAGRARGASAKAQWADQVIEVTARTPFGVNAVGFADVTSRKDRRGRFPDGASMATFVMDATNQLSDPFAHLGNSVQIELQPPGTAKSSYASVGDLILDALTAAGGTASWKDLRSLPELARVSGADLVNARKALTANGTVDSSVGKRSAITLSLRAPAESP